jgi:PAS domain S-box-containing protein
MTDRMALPGVSKREAPPAKGHEVLVSGAVVKAIQTVSGEIILDRLIQTLMTLALEHAGAERGLLILLRGDTPWIEAEARTEHNTVEVKLRQETVAPAEMPESLLRTVLWTQQSLILGDATAPNPFSADAYLRQQRVRSVLCLPLLKQAKLIGLLYLENNLASHVFTSPRVVALELLASQAAISLENARLYADLTQENRERQTAEDAMRLSEARWRSLFENVPVGVALVGPHGRYVEVNPAFRKMTGYSEAELLHLTPPDITHEDDRPAAEARTAARAAGMPYETRVEKRYRRKEGGIIWADVSVFWVPVEGNVPLHAAVAVDITERKRAEDALRRSENAMRVSEARWRSLFGHVPVGVTLVGPHGRYVEANPAFCTMTGYSEAELQQLSPVDITYEEDRAASKAVIAAHGARMPYAPCLEKRYRRKDGGIIWAELNIFEAPIVGSVPLYGAVEVDITERKRAEAALRRSETAMRVSEARWRSLFENVPVGVALVGPDRRYVEVNPTFCRMTGYSAAELQHFSPGDITHEDDRAATEVVLAAGAAGEAYIPRIEKRYRRKDGGITWGELSTFVAPVVGSAPLHAGVIVDITEHKRAEAALRRSEAYLTEAQRLSRTGSFVWKVASGDLFWSEASFDIYGYDPARVTNVEMAVQRVHPEDLALVQTTINHAASTGRDFDIEHRLLMPDGAVRYVHIVGRHLRDQADELEFIGSVMDITAAKRAEESLQKAQADLAHAARVTTLGELAASIAHEISQPLAAVATNGDACMRWLNRDPPNLDAARQVASRIVQDAHRAGDVIRSLRALAVKSGPQLTKFDLNGAIEEVLALTRGNRQRQSVQLHTDLSANMPPVMGDRVQLQQVLLNLITNGIDAMGDVTDRLKMLTITSKSDRPGGVLVGVEDTGTGFEPAMADQLFAPFYTTKSDGMGMGLAICRTIIEAHGGQLWAKPNVPQGTIFQFRLAMDDDLSDFALRIPFSNGSIGFCSG